MRIELPITMFNNTDPQADVTIPINYEGQFLRAIKIGMQKSNYEFYEQMYTNKRQIKNFAMSMYFPNAKFHGKQITLAHQPNNAKMFFTTSNPLILANYLNAFTTMKHAKNLQFDRHIDYQINEIQTNTPRSIKNNTAIFKTLSPVLVQNHAHWYLDPTKDIDEYTKSLKISIKNHLNNPELTPLVEDLKFIPLDLKHRVMNLFTDMVSGVTGTFAIQADPKLLNELNENGIGSNRGCFKGMIRQIA